MAAIIALALGEKPKKRIRFKPLPHQRKAIHAVVKGLESNDRGQLILPCGAGKTLTSLWIKERMKPKRTLVLVPSLALLRQMRQEWATHEKKPTPYLCVCSENDIDKGRDAIKTHAFEVGGHVTTDVQEVRRFARKHEEFVVYSTYQSLEVLADARVAFDLALCDEAHKTAGPRSNLFALVHDQKRVKIAKRLYMTATPRITSAKARAKLTDMDLDVERVVADMSDETTYGPELLRMSFAEAIELGILSEYQIILAGVTHAELNEHVTQRTYTATSTVDQVALAIALQKVMDKYGATHPLCFHSTIERSQVFCGLMAERNPALWVKHVDGKMSTNDRQVSSDEFREEDRAVLTNSRCFTEGVDVPAIDCVVFGDPKKSQVDIVQAAGRALRRFPGKEAGYIVVPVMHDDPDNPEERISKSVFKPIINVIKAMSAHDERLVAEMNDFKFAAGARKLTKGLVRIETGERFILEGFEDELREALFTQLIERVADNWEVMFRRLEEYKAEYGHSDPSTTKTGALGRWVNAQRTAFAKGALDESKVERLNSVQFVWSSWDSKWDSMLRKLVEYIDEHGDYPVTQSKSPLANWVDRQRVARRDGKLSPSRLAKLESVGFVFDPGKAKKIDAEIARNIYLDPKTVNEIAKAYTVSSSNVEAIKAGTIWGHATEGIARVPASSTRLSRDELIEIYRAQGSIEKVAARFETSKSTVQRVRSGFFAHVLGDEFPPWKSNRMSPETALAIYRAKGRNKDIASAFGVKPLAVSKIKNGRTWAHVTGHKTDAAE
ncbi:MAG: Helicase associated domain protein [Myxococcota bacterium]